MGVDIFLQWRNGTPADLGRALAPLGLESLGLELITNRGVKVWPDGFPETFCVDHWRCRFRGPAAELRFAEVLELQSRLLQAGFDIVKTENLYTFDGQPGYAAVHG